MFSPFQLKLFSAESLGFARIAAISPASRVADVSFNTASIIDAMREASKQGVALAVFPELAITSYSCGDLFRQQRLLEAAIAGLDDIATMSGSYHIAAVVGLPFEVDGRLFNCAAFVAEGSVKGIVPKSAPPNYSEFYELRHFSRAHHATRNTVRTPFNHDIPFGTDLLFNAINMPNCVVAIEICEDLWMAEPPSGKYAMAGATMILNPSASPDQLGKSGYRTELVKQQSARCLAAYAYAGAGPGESTMDVVYGGHSLIAENGVFLAETQRFEFDTQMAIADVDLQRLNHERLINTTAGMSGQAHAMRMIDFMLAGVDDEMTGDLKHPLAQLPFVPADPTQRARNCREIFAIQSTGLARRLLHTGSKGVTIGISGGLDSTLALLVIARAFDKLNMPREGIRAITMPGFGTTDRTYNNALALMKALGTTVMEIPIRDAVLQHFEDIDHDPNQHDVTYENAQARERTQILMDMANKHGGFVVGTGDLSEAALGWMTFNGDHMSMYHVNAGVPKTLVRYLVQWCADEEFSGETSLVLNDIVGTPISPELLPLKGGQLQQKTEDTIGPYPLHDFFLFHHVRYGMPPRKIFWLAKRAFSDSTPPHPQPPTGTFRLSPGERGADPIKREEYDEATILKWLGVFYARFFSQQFKRSSMPDGPKVGSVALSPRGDWRMPSDASSATWKEEVERIHESIHEKAME
jgi:NAD+ synthase (glutamine-hydrolysing)